MVQNASGARLAACWLQEMGECHCETMGSERRPDEQRSSVKELEAMKDKEPSTSHRVSTVFEPWEHSHW